MPSSSHKRPKVMRIALFSPVPWVPAMTEKPAIKSKRSPYLQYLIPPPHAPILSSGPPFRFTIPALSRNRSASGVPDRGEEPLDEDHQASMKVIRPRFMTMNHQTPQTAAAEKMR